jgi:sortase A
MNPTSGGPDPREAQRQAAKRLARERVLSSYTKRVEQIVVAQEQQSAQPAAQHPAKQPEAPGTNVDPDTWKQYHTAWATYYQKYYHEYYTKAASNFAKTERQKAEEKAREAAEAHAEAERLRKKHEQPLTPAQKIRADIRARASGHFEKIRKSHHFVPILVGLAIVLAVVFLEYNRNIAAPILAYISPGNVSATEIAEIDPTVTTDIGADTTLIIPKLNVQVPLHLGIPNDSASVNAAMANGVAQFAIPGANAMPGQIGNLVISGHSASDVYSSNQYKFIFAGLPRLEGKDLIYINYQSKRYTYAVTSTRVVNPNEVEALTEHQDKPILTLITCVPLGTSRNRLLVFAEQINPDPDAATAPAETPTEPQVTQADLPANPPTFFENVWYWLTGQRS